MRHAALILDNLRETVTDALATEQWSSPGVVPDSAASSVLVSIDCYCDRSLAWNEFHIECHATVLPLAATIGNDENAAATIHVVD